MKGNRKTSQQRGQVLEFIKHMEFHQAGRRKKQKVRTAMTGSFSVMPLRVSVVPVGLLALWVPWRANSRRKLANS